VALTRSDFSLLHFEKIVGPTPGDFHFLRGWQRLPESNRGIKVARRDQRGFPTSL
jgi:hypothetical protein